MKITCILLVLVLPLLAAGASPHIIALPVLGSPQSVSDLDGLTPVGLQPGSPAGSYVLSGLDTINLYNGSANITIPLLKIGGRGEAGYTMVASYNAHWDGVGSMSTDAPCSFSAPCPVWGLSTTGWLNADYAYRPAGIGIRHLGQGTRTIYDSNGNQSCAANAVTLTRIGVDLADGTEITLVDAATGGAPGSASSCNPQGFDRGTVFVSTDGSAITFVADDHVYDANQPGATYLVGDTGTGTLYFRDGRQFHFGKHNINGSDADCASSSGFCPTVIDRIQDRNGNQTTFDYSMPVPTGFQSAFAVTDPLGRLTNVAMGSQYTFTDDANAGCTPGNPCIGVFDQITYNGVSGQPARTITVYRRSYWYDRMASLQNSAQPTYQDLFGGYASPSASPFDGAISKIVLPDGHTYRFYYTQYAEVALLDLPTGGRYEFDWVNGPNTDPYDVCPANPENNKCPVIRAPSFMQTLGWDLLIAVYRRLSERREYVDAGPSWTRRTTYSVSESNAAVSGDPLGRCGFVSNPNYESGYCSQVVKNEYGPVQGQLSSEAHYFYGAVSPYQDLFPQPGWYSFWLEGREFRTNIVQPGGSPLHQQLQTWQERAIPAWWSPQFSGPLPALDARVGGSDRILDSGKMARRLFVYSPSTSDNTNNIVDLWEYDYGDTTGSQGALLRRTHTDFLTTYNNPSFGIYLRDLPSGQIVYDGSANIVAQTQYGYDESTVSDETGIVQNVAVTPQRGNLTHVNRWRNTDGAWLTTNNLYDRAGNIISVTNPRGYSTSYTYGDCAGMYALVTSITNAAAHTTTFGHDCSLGQITSITDPNGFQTTVQYGNFGQDVLDRLSKVIRANGQQSAYSYSSDLTMVTTSSDQYAAGDQKLVSVTVSDGLGRSVESRVYTSPNAYISTRKDQDALGRTMKAYNPGSTTDGTVYTYDALGRVLTTTYADGSQDVFQWTGDTVLHTDPASKQRKRQVDALGRTIGVTEDPNGQNLTTSYSYDALDDLTAVIQGAQSRSFRYNSLRQLVSATNPEIDAVVTCATDTVSECYAYDTQPPSENLKTKNAPGVQTTFTYDSLDRMRKKEYSDGTATVTYLYDATQKGCLDSVSNAAATMAFLAYNPNCVVTASRQTMGSQNFDFSYAYNLASELTQESYPSGRIVSYHYDTAGRADRIGNGPLSGPNSYATGITYAPHGAIASMTLGVTSANPGWPESWQYNNRLQPVLITAGNGALKLELSYCPSGAYSCAVNNGNLLRQVITRSGTVWIQDYPTTAYDPTNRLISAQETSGGGNWSETYGYDRYGNGWVASYSGLPAPNLETPQSQAWYLPNNRIAGWGYTDRRGNVTSIQYMPRTFTYDGENRQLTASVNSVNSSYSYDGEGRRVQKVGGGVTTNYVYDAFGHLAAEYGLPNSNPGTRYLNVDHLGSTRLVTDASGAPLECHDFLPFGQEILAGIDGRGSCFPSSPSGGLNFAGKLRDAETNFDFFGARYNSAAQGRFTTTDPLPGWQTDPQSWNAYAYARNNPLMFSDPDGQTYRICAQGSQCVDVSDDEFALLQQNPGPGIGLWNGDIHAFVNGQWQNAGTYWQTDVDLPFDVSMALRAAGQTADRELKNAMKDAAISALGGVALSAAGVAITRATTIGVENLPLLRQVSRFLSNNTLKHIVNQGHLAEFQKLLPGISAEEVAQLGIEVAETGRQVLGKTQAFERSMNIGGQWVTVRVWVTAQNTVRSVYILP